MRFVSLSQSSEALLAVSAAQIKSVPRPFFMKHQLLQAPLLSLIEHSARSSILRGQILPY